MELLAIFLNDEQHANDVLSIFVELDVRHVSQVESESLIEALASDVPIFAGLRQLFEQSERRASRTILALVEEDDVFDRMVKLCEELEIDFSNPDVGCMFTVPVARIAGR